MATSLHIGIDGEALRKPLAGVGQYVYNLCCELETLLPEATFFVYARLPAEQLALPSSRWILRREPRAWLRKLPSFLWLKLRGSALCRQDRLDVFWAGRTLHAGKRAAARTVVTVHDLNHRLVPETMEAPTLWSHRLWFDRDVRSADAVLANSQGTSDRLQAALGRSADGVVRPGLRAAFCPQNAEQREAGLAALVAFGIRPPYLLAVSTLEPRKNMSALLDACLLLRQRGVTPDHQLILVGARGWQNAALAQRIQADGTGWVVLPGYVPDALLPSIYALADALVMPSLYEGFGMPVLEACAVGTPVVTSDVPELQEAAGGRAHAVEPTPERLAEAIAQVLQSPRDAGGSPLPTTTWADGARLLLSNLLSDAGRPKSAPIWPDSTRA